MRLNIKLLVFSVLAVLGCFTAVSCNSTSKSRSANVEIRESDNKYSIYVNGEPYFIKGAGIEFGSIELFAQHGGNTFRTWTTKTSEHDAIEVLDKAQENGLMVLMGIAIGRERHGYNYDDTVWVKNQLNNVKKEVERLKDHPALFGWAIGNELNLSATNLAVYDAVNDISKMIHQIDGKHPTTTPLAGIHKREVDYIKQHCSDIDFLSIQMYGSIVNLRKHIADAGWDGPYMVTEWGATGHWEVKRTEWGAPIEQTSTEKAKAFQYRYDVAIKADPDKCLGSFVFIWGQKQERTPTWYGMFLESGEETETIDVMHKIWNGTYPDNRCPSLDSVSLNGLSAYDNIYVTSNSDLKAFVGATDLDGDTLVYKWEILPESTDLGTGGDYESRPKTIFISEVNSPVVIAKAPIKEGAYRLFVYILDGENHAATANIPFYVKNNL